MEKWRFQQIFRNSKAIWQCTNRFSLQGTASYPPPGGASCQVSRHDSEKNSWGSKKVFFWILQRIFQWNSPTHMDLPLIMHQISRLQNCGSQLFMNENSKKKLTPHLKILIVYGTEVMVPNFPLFFIVGSTGITSLIERCTTNNLSSKTSLWQSLFYVIWIWF